MMPKTKSDMGIGLAIQLHFLGVMENFGIIIGSSPADGDTTSGGDPLSMDLRFHGTDPANMGQGCDRAKQFFGRMRNS